MKINSFNIDTSDMSTGRVIKPFTITGDKGAEFEIIALQSGTLKYYDFKNKVFEDGHNDLHNNLKVKLGGKNYTNNIIFPSGGGDYVIKLITINGTETSSSNSKVIISLFFAFFKASFIVYSSSLSLGQEKFTFPAYSFFLKYLPCSDQHPVFPQPPFSAPPQQL